MIEQTWKVSNFNLAVHLNLYLSLCFHQMPHKPYSRVPTWQRSPRRSGRQWQAESVPPGSFHIRPRCLPADVEERLQCSRPEGLFVEYETLVFGHVKQSLVKCCNCIRKIRLLRLQIKMAEWLRPSLVGAGVGSNPTPSNLLHLI